MTQEAQAAIRRKCLFQLKKQLENVLFQVEKTFSKLFVSPEIHT